MRVFALNTSFQIANPVGQFFLGEQTDYLTTSTHAFTNKTVTGYGGPRLTSNYFSHRFGKDPDGAGKQPSGMGWVRFHDLGNNNGVEVVDWAFEDDIQAAGSIHLFDRGTPKGGQQIPEPGTLATLALGAAGIFAWRRHRQKQAEKAKKETATAKDDDLMMS